MSSVRRRPRPPAAFARESRRVRSCWPIRHDQRALQRHRRGKRMDNAHDRSRNRLCRAGRSGVANYKSIHPRPPAAHDVRRAGEASHSSSFCSTIGTRPLAALCGRCFRGAVRSAPVRSDQENAPAGIALRRNERSPFEQVKRDGLPDNRRRHSLGNQPLQGQFSAKAAT